MMIPTPDPLRQEFMDENLTFGGFHSHGGTPNGWFIGENLLKMANNWEYPI